MSKRTYDTIGTIIKQERLVNVDYHVLPNSLVLEIQDAFHGYHHETPKEGKPSYLFLITQKVVSRESVARASKIVKKYFDHSFDAAASMITIYNDHYFGIRIKDLDSYELIHEIQQCFSAEGIEFKRKKEINEVGIIHVKKFFNLVEGEDELLFDDNPNMAYFTIGRNLSWKLFAQITKNIKNNWDFKDFDAAFGTMYRNGEIEDITRIYWEKLDLAKLKLIKEKYQKEIAKY
ncbi:MAG: hypothetical protein HOK35_11780 [Cytophagia bacterium]|jgi:hypothetical protein|nr:hypothetical protein [Cytophagia bacterium]